MHTYLCIVICLVVVVWQELKQPLHESNHNKVCGLSQVTSSWFLERDIAVEFFRCFFCLFVCLLFCCFEHKPRAVQFHDIWEKAGISSTNISKTQLISEQSSWINVTAGRGKMCIFDFGVNCPFWENRNCCFRAGIRPLGAPYFDQGLNTVSFLREKLKDVLDTTRMDVTGGRDSCSMSHSLSNSPMTSPGPGNCSCHGPGPSPSSCQGPRHCEAPDLNPNLCQAHRTCQGPGHISSQCHGPGPGQCAGSDQGPSFPSLPDSLLSEGPSLASIPDALNSSSSSLPPIPDIMSPMPVYPAGVLLVCNSCVAYQQLVEAQSPMRKWALRRKNEPVEARIHRLERERTAKKNKRACETDEEREMRRLRDREAKRMQRMQESDEQRARRLQRDREAMRLKRANETPEKRQARLIREREAKRIKRRLEKIDPALRTQIEHDPAAMAALTADMSLFQFPCPMPVPSIDNGLFMKLP